MKTEIDNRNKSRTRFYGLRKGDIVSPRIPTGEEWHKGQSEVIDYGFMDNNSVYIKSNDGTETKWIAEYCNIIIKVEDRHDR
jgi:hypothetical protein